MTYQPDLPHLPDRPDLPCPPCQPYLSNQFDPTPFAP